MKRIIALLLLVVLTLTACSQSTVSQPQNTEPSVSGDSKEETKVTEEVSKSDENDDFVLKVGYGGSLCEAPLHVAVEKGFFEEEGLKVEAIKLAPGTAFESLTAKKTDAGFALLANLVQPISNGLPAKITTGLHTGCDKVLVAKDSGIESVADLKGKKIGVPSMNSSPIIFTKRVLADEGIGVSEKNLEVEFVVFAANDLAIALENGAIDAIAMNDPTATIAKNEYDLNVIADSAIDEGYKDQYCCSAYVHQDIAEQYPEIAAKYTRAMQKASAYVQENPDEVTKLQVENNWVAGDPEVNAEVIKTFNYIPAVTAAYDAFGITAKKLQEIGMLDEQVDVDALQKNSFVFLEGVPDTVESSGRVE